MIARTARPPALNSLGALIMPSLQSQIAFNRWGGRLCYLKADLSNPILLDTIGFLSPKAHPALASRWHYFLAHHWASIVGTAHFNPWFRGTDQFIDLLIEFPEYASFFL